MPLLPQRLKDILVQGGCLSPADFDFAVHQSEKTGRSVEEIIVDNSLMADRELGQKIAAAIGLPFVDLAEISIPKELRHLLSLATSRENQVVVFGRSLDNGKFKLATHKPENYDFIRKFEQKLDCRAELYYATPHSVNRCLDEESGILREDINQILKSFADMGEDREEDAARMVDFIIQRAHCAMASDVHLNPGKKQVSVRFRIDGIVYPIAAYPRRIHDQVVNRIKVLSHLRTDEQKAAQDGRFDFYSDDEEHVNIRVSVIPVICGQNVVMRFLADKSRQIVLEETGLSGPDLDLVRKHMGRTHGMILCVGPSGSGKTTTIYAMLQVLNRPDVNITTIEDPIEFNIEGIQQVQVDPLKNITFASGLRSLARQDPDIMVVGEIRDRETAGIAVNSAMAGHLVLSSMHANDSTTIFPRFMEMGVEPFLVASSVNLVISQRLVRRICHVCRQSHVLEKKERAFIEGDPLVKKTVQETTGLKDLSKIRLYRGAGCKICHGTGYVGRIGIFELLEVDEDIRSMLTLRASASEIRRHALGKGLKEILKDGLDKALMGETTLEELIREINF